MSQENYYKLVSKLKPGRIVIPILIGLAVVAWFIVKEIDTDALSQLNFTWKSVILAFYSMVLYDRTRSWVYDTDKDPVGERS